MPTITLDRKEFDRLMGKKIPEDKLKDRISMIGTDLESLDDKEIVVEVFPNRPDMLSMQGFVRAMRGFVGLSKGLQRFDVKKSGEKVIIDKSVAGVRPYTACALVKGLKFDDEKIREIIQVQEKLHTSFGRNRKKAAIGIYPFEKIKTPIRFTAKKPKEIRFTPLESGIEMDGLQILKSHPTGREYAHLLRGKEIFPVFIDANNNILSMPPIINSEITGKVTSRTKDVFIECSGFDMKTLNLCLNMIVTTMADMGGEICSMELEYPDKKIVTPNLKPEKRNIDLKRINKLLGLNLEEKEAKELLEKMGFGYEKETVLVPSYRADIMHEVDFAEDIAIAYGYENFKEEIPKVSTIAEESPMGVLTGKISQILIGLGLIELNTYNLTNKENQTKMMCADTEVIEIENSVSNEYSVLRAWLIPCLMETLKANKQHEYPQRIFDTGIVFAKDKEEDTGVREEQYLAVAITEPGANFTSIKQVLDYLMGMCGIEHALTAKKHPSFIDGRCAAITAGTNPKYIGILGEIHPNTLCNWGLKMPVAVLEISLTGLLRILS